MLHPIYATTEFTESSVEAELRKLAEERDVKPGVLINANAISSVGAMLERTLLSPAAEKVAAVALFLVLAVLFLSLRGIVAVLASVALGIAFVLVAELQFGVMNAFDVVTDAIAMLLVFQFLKYVFVAMVDDMMTVQWRALMRLGSGTRP